MQEDQHGHATEIFESFAIEQEDDWRQSLREKGAVVIKNILNAMEVQYAISLFWQWLESMGIGIKRDEPATWNKWPGMKDMGFFATYGGCHTKASWYLRCHPKVRSAFAKIWSTEELISSFDTFIGWKPWWLTSECKPQVQNLHVDQNPHFKKGLKCVQGMIPLKRVREAEVGGLMAVPRTNNDKTQQQLTQRYPGTTHYKSDWLQLTNNDPYVKQKKGVLIQCDAGDLILWDSRTIHGGKVCQPSQEFKQSHCKDFVRLALTVTMVPRNWMSKQVHAQRKNAFKKKKGLTHWPHEFHESCMGEFLVGVSTNQIKYEWPEQNPEIDSLI